MKRSITCLASLMPFGDKLHLLRCFPTETTDRRRPAPLEYRFGRLDNDVGARRLAYLAFASQLMSVQTHGGPVSGFAPSCFRSSDVMLPRIKGLVSRGYEHGPSRVRIMEWHGSATLWLELRCVSHCLHPTADAGLKFRLRSFRYSVSSLMSAHRVNHGRTVRL